MGKSRLLAAVGDRASSSAGGSTASSATRALTTVPFGAFAATLTVSVARGSGDRFAILQDALAELSSNDGMPVLLVVGDAQHLDEGGAALVSLGARTGLVVVVAVRGGEPCPDAITSLWKDDLAARIDLAPLDSAGVGEVLASVLGAPVDSGTAPASRGHDGRQPLVPPRARADRSGAPRAGRTRQRLDVGRSAHRSAGGRRPRPEPPGDSGPGGASCRGGRGARRADRDLAARWPL